MLCNLQSITIVSHRREHYPDGLIYLGLTINGEKHRYTDGVYLTPGQAMVLADNLAGSCDGLAVVDGYNTIAGDMRGLTILKPSSPMTNYTFPGDILAGWIRQAVCDMPADIAVYESGEYSPQYTRTYGDGVTSLVAADYAPIVIFDYGDGVRDRLIRDMTDSRQTRLADCLDGLRRVASSYSSGQPATAHVRLDDSYNATKYPNDPTSYYWWIECADGSRGMNGGIIAHAQYPRWDYKKNEPAPPTPDDDKRWEYSTHT